MNVHGATTTAWVTCRSCPRTFRVAEAWLVVACPGCGVINRITQDRLIRRAEEGE